MPASAPVPNSQATVQGNGQSNVIIDCKIDHLYYGKFLAVRDSHIAVVTHNLQQAMRVADKTAFMYVDTSRGGRTGYLVEYGDTKQLFENPQQEYTGQYIRGEFS